MSRKYKFHDPDGTYFVTSTVVKWVDVFTRDDYRYILIDSFNWCMANKGLVIHAWVIMSNHIHLIISRNGNVLLQDIMRDLKKFTSVKILDAIENNIHESRKDWMLKIFEEAGRANSNNVKYQFWQQHNHPIALDNNRMLDQRLDYLHHNPVKQGLAFSPEDFIWSSARDYIGEKGPVEIKLLR